MTEPTLDTGITTDIYPMPAFITIESSDVDHTFDQPVGHDVEGQPDHAQ